MRIRYLTTSWFDCTAISVLFILLTASMTEAVGAACPCSIWPTASPVMVADPDTAAVELGVKFQADVDGYITGIRFYKSTTNTGTHAGTLWSNTGRNLATATFKGETASGWQQVNFTTPAAITANTVYIASYHTNRGHYADDMSYFATAGVDNPPLHALRNGVNGPNGVYRYGSTSGFPTDTSQADNYWVDVVFNATATADTTPPTVTAFSIPATATTLTIPITAFTATDNVGVTGYLVNKSATPPSAAASGWSATKPTSYTFTSAGSKTLYAWAKDATGNVSASMSATVTITLSGGAAGPEPDGWYAGDMHVHRSCGGSPEALSSLYTKMSSNNLAVISLLADMGNGEVQNPTTDLPLVNGQDAAVSTPGRIVHWDAEWHWDATYTQYPHQALGGHLVALGVNSAQQMWAEYTYPILQWAHDQGGIAGFAHMQYLDNSIPQTLSCCTPIEYPVEVALGSADFISEDVADASNSVSGMDPEAAISAYYRLLNTGFRPGLAAGTDYPCNSSRPLGSLLTYVQVAGNPMTYSNWIAGIKTGRTVISRNRHNEFLSLMVNNSATPGDVIQLTSSGSVPVTITWAANQNLTGTIELVQNGAVVASQQASVTAGGTATLTTTADFSKSGWLAARRMDSNEQHYVHTAAVFVIVNNAPIRVSAADAQFYVDWMDTLIAKTSGEWKSYFPTSLSKAQDRYRQAKAIYQQRVSEVIDITTTALPNGTVNQAYSTTLIASGGAQPYSWSIISGSLPPGLALNANSGTISGTPTTVGPFSFTAQVKDVNSLTATKSLTIVISATQPTTKSIWPSTAMPGTVDAGPDGAVELGVKFSSDVTGTITGIRFYKASTNTGTHTGTLWSITGPNTGTKLVTATFTGETASGWQQVNFAAPVTIQANTVYVASYHTNVGHYADDIDYFATAGVDNPPLHALQGGVNGPNGVYLYTPSGGFPFNGWYSSNYWVDVVFQPGQ